MGQCRYRGSLKGRLVPETDYPICVLDTFESQKMYKISDSCFTYDFGQNASGIIDITVKGKRGQIIRIWPGEWQSMDKRVNQVVSGSPYYFEYVLKGDSIDEHWRPKFTYYGFRYATVEGATPVQSQDVHSPFPELCGIKALHTRNSSPQVGKFECSSDLMNRIYQLINWAIRSNMQSVLTDCPHREKLGWLEQSYLMGDSIRYNYSIYYLYRKMVRDMIAAQHVDGLLPDIAPELVKFSGGFIDSPEWGSVGVILPWLIYKWFGDKSILNEAYDMMERYVEYLRSESHQHLLSYGLGDGFDDGLNPPGVSQLTPLSLTASATYYYDVKLLAQISTVLNKKRQENDYKDLSEKINKAFNDKFYDVKNKSYATASQTSNAMALCAGLVDEWNKRNVYESLVRSIERDQHALTAGDIGFHYLVEALSVDQIYSETLYKMINRQDFPGYGYQLAKGATALTESGPASEDVSNNHLMLGHIVEWFYTCILGINDEPDAIASNPILLRPMLIGDIEWAAGLYSTPRGIIEVKWRKQGDALLFKCSIPNGTKGRIIFLSGYKNISTENKVIPFGCLKRADHHIEIEILGGDYHFILKKNH